LTQVVAANRKSRMRNALKALGAGALLVAGLPSGTAAPARPRLTACELEHPLRLSVLAAECGTLSVAENPRAPDARRIELHFARVPAISRRKLPDPLIVLAGGPGAAATAFYASVAGAFARIHRDRDIILLDQRGTGGSNPLDCGRDREPLYRGSEAEIAADTRRCLADLSARAAVQYYTTSLAVADLEQLRAALGYPQVNLYGTSYGTRVAQHYLRRFGAHVRSAILDGVVAPTQLVGADTALDAEAALARILGRCAADAPCRSRYGDPADAYRGVRTALAARAVPVSVADPSSGAPTHFDFGPDQLATVLRLASYTPEYAALLPLLLHDAAAAKDFTPLAAQFLLIERAYAQVLATGMHNSVVCAEDVPFYDLAHIDRARLAGTFLGTLQLDGLITVCRIWPHGAVDADFHAPLHSDVPVLLLSGSDDPVTPPAYAESVRAGLPHARHVVLQGFGHGQLTAPCVDRLMARFLERPDAESVDAACVRAARPQAFFTSINGPAP
jgi:pimeloyl-ACP methyl ester carboxylesterase